MYKWQWTSKPEGRSIKHTSKMFYAKKSLCSPISLFKLNEFVFISTHKIRHTTQNHKQNYHTTLRCNVTELFFFLANLIPRRWAISARLFEKFLQIFAFNSARKKNENKALLCGRKNSPAPFLFLIRLCESSCFDAAEENLNSREWKDFFVNIWIFRCRCHVIDVDISFLPRKH